MAGPTRAATYYFDQILAGTSGVWNNANNWSDGSGHTGTIPGSADRAVVVGQRTCEVSTDVKVDSIEVQAYNSVIVVDVNHTISLSNTHHNTSNSVDDHIVNGLVDCSGNSATHGSLAFTSHDHTITGTGEVLLEKNAQMQIEYGRIVISELATSGQGVRGIGGSIVATGTVGTLPQFYNEGIVAADDDNPGIILSSNVDLFDVSGAEWRIDSDTTAMWFERAATGLAGDFVGHCANSPLGTFVFDATIATTGTLTRNKCGLYATGTNSFCYGGFAGGTTGCPNPVSGSGPWTITGSYYGPCSCP